MSFKIIPVRGGFAVPAKRQKNYALKFVRWRQKGPVIVMIGFNDIIKVANSRKADLIN